MLGLATAAATILHAYERVIVRPRIIDGTSLLAYVCSLLDLIVVLIFFSLFVVGAILLLRRKLCLSACYLACGITMYASFFGVAAIADDRVTFPSASHREIASIYRRESGNFDIQNPDPHLILLDERCHPPGACYCYVLIDSGHRSGVENDLDGWLGGWRRPTTSILRDDSFRFSVASVRRLDWSAYSVLGCEMDRSGLFPN